VTPADASTSAATSRFRCEKVAAARMQGPRALSDEMVGMRFPALAIPALAAACAAVFAVAGGFATERKGARVPTLRVTERDFRIAAPREVRAGNATLRVDNTGPDSHELIVVRVAGGGLPLRRDGLTVDEDAVEHETAGALEPGEPGTRPPQSAMALARLPADQWWWPGLKRGG
jgi:hypothetical protein